MPAPPQSVRSLELDSVSFAYPSRPDTLALEWHAALRETYEPLRTRARSSRTEG